MDTRRGRHLAFDPAMENCQPSQNETEVDGCGEYEIRADPKCVEVDVGLIEPVEQHQGVCSGVRELSRHVPHGGEVWPHLDGERHIDGLPDRFHQLEIRMFYVLRRLAHICRQPVDVQLQCVNALVGEDLGVESPPPCGDSVETGDDRDVELGSCPSHQVEVVLGTCVVVVQLRKEPAGGLTKAVGAHLDSEVDSHSVVFDLLLEETRKHDRRGTGLDQGVNVVNVACEG